MRTIKTGVLARGGVVHAAAKDHSTLSSTGAAYQLYRPMCQKLNRASVTCLLGTPGPVTCKKCLAKLGPVQPGDGEMVYEPCRGEDAQQSPTTPEGPAMKTVTAHKGIKPAATPTVPHEAVEADTNPANDQWTHGAGAAKAPADPTPPPAAATAAAPAGDTTSAATTVRAASTRTAGTSSPLAGLRLEGRSAGSVPHVEVTALAGTGKTTTVIEGLKAVRGLPTTITPSEQQAAVWEQMRLGRSDTVRVCAFNTTITEEVKGRLKASGLDQLRCEAKGIHSMGFGAVNKAFGYQEPTNFAVQDHVAALLGGDARQLKRQPAMATLITATEELVGLCKQTLTEPTVEGLDALTSHYDVETNGQRQRVYELVPQVLDRCLAPTGRIAFDDMIWLPVKLGLPIFRTDVGVVDECLPGWTPVMLADGGSKQVSNVRVGDYVRSYDTATGRAMNCKVLATQKLANRKPLVKIKVRHNHKTAGNRKTNFVVCTTDHKVWTVNRGWVEAGSVQMGDTVVVETAAATIQKGKISTVGRDKLSNIHVGNTKGNGTNGGQTAVEFNRVKGGNGRGPTDPQTVLSEALGEGWVTEHIVPTGGRGIGYPTHYKLDLANPEYMVAVEVDGASHRGNEEQDCRKDQFLTDNGWTVYRVTNRQVARDLAGLVQDLCPDGTRCPMTATVVSVEDTYITEHYVYDITVDRCHNFYANGILVHNCQDLNRMQQELVYRSAHRLVFVGDRRQAIYGFAGADAASMDRMRDTLAATPRGCVTLPLTVTRRCGKAIVEEARRIVPEYRAHEDNCDGLVGRLDYPTYRGGDGRMHERKWEDSYCAAVRPGDMLLCRCNAPLVSQCFRFLKAGVKATILGRKIGEGLIGLLGRSRQTAVPDLVSWLGDWLAKEQAVEQAKRYPSDARLIALQDKYDCLVCFAGGCQTVADVEARINAVFTDDGNGPGVRLSSIHKSKGLEARRVFLLEPEGATVPHPMARKAWERQQETNLRYVAVTRAIEELYYVS